ncbi:MAG: EMC3/TMCO1 family protein [Methanobacteriaceae archaeon]
MVLEFITEPIFGALNTALMPLITAVGPIVTIFIIAAVVAFFITLVNKLLVDQDRLEAMQKEMKVYQSEMMAAQKSGDQAQMEKMKKKQAEFMKLQQEMMGNSFKPMIVTMVPILLVFWWMATVPAITNFYMVIPTVTYYTLLVPLFHMFYHPSAFVPAGVMAIEWLGWYILCSFSFSLVFRKYLGMKGGM